MLRYYRFPYVPTNTPTRISFSEDGLKWRIEYVFIALYDVNVDVFGYVHISPLLYCSPLRPRAIIDSLQKQLGAAACILRRLSCDRVGSMVFVLFFNPLPELLLYCWIGGMGIMRISSCPWNEPPAIRGCCSRAGPGV